MRDIIGCVLIIIGAAMAASMMIISAFIFHPLLGIFVSGGVLIILGMIVWE